MCDLKLIVKHLHRIVFLPLCSLFDFDASQCQCRCRCRCRCKSKTRATQGASTGKKPTETAAAAATVATATPTATPTPKATKIKPKLCGFSRHTKYKILSPEAGQDGDVDGVDGRWWMGHPIVR